MSPALLPPLVVVWRVIEACDLGCWYCEYNRHLQGPRHTAHADEVLSFGRVLGEYSVASGRSVFVSWLGGEPLLWPALVSVGSSFKHEYGLRLSLTTNGRRLASPGLIQHLVEDYAEVTVSVDGLGDFHDSARDAPGLFDNLRAVVGELHERKSRLGHGPLLRANTILMRSNLFAFEALCQALAGWGIEELTFNALGGQPPGPHYARERLQPQHVAWLRAALPGIRQRLAPQGFAIRGGGRYLTRLESSARGDKLPIMDCHPGADFLFVDEHGRAAPCSFTSAGYGIPIAELCGADDIARLPARMAQQRKTLLGPCLDCPSTQVFGKLELKEVV